MKPRKSPARRMVAGISTSVFAILLCLVAAEAGFRLLRMIRPARAVADAELGWRMNSDISRRMHGLRRDGAAYEITYSTGPNGFRFWGSPGPEQRKLLVIGDSYTEASQVSDHKTYYSLLAGRLGSRWSLFAYGAGGYGTLQEYLVMRRHWDAIQPDLVIWQWCVNDLWNNTYDLDTRTVANFNITPRPYWENGKAVMRYPHEIPVISRHSRLWLWLAPRLMSTYANRSAAAEIDACADPGSPLFTEASRVTDEILAAARQRTGKTPVIVFTVGEPESARKILDGLAVRHGFMLVDDIDKALLAAEQTGMITTAHASIGGHWSEEGHEVVADVLFHHITNEVGSLFP